MTRLILLLCLTSLFSACDDPAMAPLEVGAIQQADCPSNLCSFYCVSTNPCVVFDCNQPQCTCSTSLPNGNQCGTNDMCLTPGSCDGHGTCAGETAIVPSACDDGNPCTDDGCSDNNCTHVNNSAACPGGVCIQGSCCTGCVDANNACQTGDDVALCGAGGSACASCDDGNLCTTDSCSNGSCVNSNCPGGGTCLAAGCCTGCVDLALGCQAGTSPSACGTGGAACLVCGACINGVCGCASDSDCGGPTTGRICVGNGCVDGCRGEDGNGCTVGLVCSSTTSAAGDCLEPDAGLDAGLDASVESDSGTLLLADSGEERDAEQAVVDAGHDAGFADSGPARPDAASAKVDAGPVDSGAQVADGSRAGEDASLNGDGSAVDRYDVGGCGCSGGSGRSVLALVLIAGLALIRASGRRPDRYSS